MITKDNNEKLFDEILSIIKMEVGNATHVPVDTISDSQDLRKYDIDSMGIMLIIGNIESDLTKYDPNFELGYDVIYKNYTPYNLAVYISDKIHKGN